MNSFKRGNLLTIIVFVAMTVSFGCTPTARDISDQPRIRNLGLVGACLVVKTELPLIAIKAPYRRMALAEPTQPQTGGPGQRLGTVLGGTHLRVLRVERAITFSDGMFVVYSEIAFARIETGAHAGKVVDLGLGWGSLALPEIDRLPEPYARCQASR